MQRNSERYLYCISNLALFCKEVCWHSGKEHLDSQMSFQLFSLHLKTIDDLFLTHVFLGWVESCCKALPQELSGRTERWVILLIKAALVKLL